MRIGKNYRLLLILLIVGFYSCNGQKSNKDTLEINERSILFFTLSEAEFNERAHENNSYYELEADYTSGIVPLMDSLKKWGITFVVTNSKQFKFKAEKDVFFIETREEDNPYGVVLFNGTDKPILLQGAYPLEYYLETLVQKGWN